MTAPAGEQQQQSDANTGAADKNSGGASGGGGDQGDRTFTQAQLNAIVAQARRETESKFEGHDDLKKKAEQLDSLTESTKSEVQRATEAATAAASERDQHKAKVSELEAKLLRQQISAREGLDPDLWDRVTGSTEADIEADVKKLATKFQTPKGVSLGSRSGSGASAPDASTKKQRAAAALRGLGASR